MLSMVGFKTIGVGSRLLHTVQGGGLGADAAVTPRTPRLRMRPHPLATPRLAAPRRDGAEEPAPMARPPARPLSARDLRPSPRAPVSTDRSNTDPCPTPRGARGALGPGVDTPRGAPLRGSELGGLPRKGLSPPREWWREIGEGLRAAVAPAPEF
jgi:hypothetical protein